MAECSLSMGSSVAPPSRTADMNTSPPTTSASLFASSRRLPARAAARQGASPAAPTMAAMTTSTSGWAEIACRASGVSITSVDDPCAASASRSARACSGLAMTA